MKADGPVADRWLDIAGPSPGRRAQAVSPDSTGMIHARTAKAQASSASVITAAG